MQKRGILRKQISVWVRLGAWQKGEMVPAYFYSVQIYSAVQMMHQRHVPPKQDSF